MIFVRWVFFSRPAGGGTLAHAPTTQNAPKSPLVMVPRCTSRTMTSRLGKQAAVDRGEVMAISWGDRGEIKHLPATSMITCTTYTVTVGPGGMPGDGGGPGKGGRDGGGGGPPGGNGGGPGGDGEHGGFGGVAGGGGKGGNCGGTPGGSKSPVPEPPSPEPEPPSKPEPEPEPTSSTAVPTTAAGDEQEQEMTSSRSTRDSMEANGCCQLVVKKPGEKNPAGPSQFGALSPLFDVKSPWAIIRRSARLSIWTNTVRFTEPRACCRLQVLPPHTGRPPVPAPRPCLVPRACVRRDLHKDHRCCCTVPLNSCGRRHEWSDDRWRQSLRHRLLISRLRRTACRWRS